MFRIIAVSDSYSHFREPIETYLGRLRWVVELKTVKPECSENAALVRRKESLKIKEYLEKEKSYIVYCDIAAKSVSTQELFTFSEHSKLTYPNLTFLVAGAYGIDETILAPFIQHRISFSPMTFPHSLALLILLEQLYRVGQIGKNSGYHH